MSASPVRKRRKEARPSELTAAALALFVEKGFAATRLEDIAARAGVSKGTLYLYFDSKEALFKSVIEEGVLPVLAENEAIAAGHAGDTYSLLEKLLDNWWVRIGETAYAGITKLMVAEALNFPDLANYYNENVIQRCRALVVQALERGMATGEFRKLEVQAAVDVLISPILMLLIWQHSFGACQCAGVAPKEFLAMHLDLARQGLLTKQL